MKTMRWDAAKELAANPKTMWGYVAHVRRNGSGHREVKEAVKLVAKALRLRYQSHFTSGRL